MQPRDVVAAAVARRISESGADHVWLDISAVQRIREAVPDAGAVGEVLWPRPVQGLAARRPRRPLRVRRCRHRPRRRDRAARPVGGGRGGVHRVDGADRLASNSLLEGMLRRPGGRAVLSGKGRPAATGAVRPAEPEGWSSGQLCSSGSQKPPQRSAASFAECAAAEPAETALPAFSGDDGRSGGGRSAGSLSESSADCKH